MRIGAAPSLPPFLPNHSGRSAANERPQAPSSDTPSASPSRPAEWMAKAQAQRAEAHDYYAADRDLSFSGRAAIDTYLTNASLMWQPGEAELLGIDLYA